MLSTRSASHAPDTTSPGTVLAVSPNNNALVVSDPVRQIISIEKYDGRRPDTYGGVGTHAEFSPDGQTVYITAGNQLLVYSGYTGWTSITPATTAGTPVTDVAITVPAVGAYFAGQTTTARSYCPISTATTPTNESNVFYPTADSSPAITDRIAATNDGLHIIGATASTANPTLKRSACADPFRQQQRSSVSVALPAPPGLSSFSNTVYKTTLAPVTATAITGVLPASDSSVAFITYTGSGGVSACLCSSASGPGTTTYIKLSGAATAPIAGVLSADNSTILRGNLRRQPGPNHQPRHTDRFIPLWPPTSPGPSGTVVPVTMFGTEASQNHLKHFSHRNRHHQN